MRQAGMTLLELVVSLGLLSAMMLVVVSWTQVSGRHLTRAVEPARWERSAAAVLQSIQDDLLIGDFSGQREGEGDQKPRVPQSTALDSREALLNLYEDVRDTLPDELAAPAGATGYRIEPSRIERLQLNGDRVHERDLYEISNEGWSHRVLVP